MLDQNTARIFISYSRRGNGLAWKDCLLSQLAVFEKQNLLDAWHDDETKLGDDWHARINAAMKGARLAVLLLTDEFLKSPFVLQHELPELQRRHKDEGLIIAPILCEKCDWEANPWLASLQIKPREHATPVPLVSLSQTNRDHVLRQLATEIAVELGDSALAEISALHPPDASLGEAKTYLDKFPLTRGPGLREERLIGREQELALLDLAFAQPHTAIVSLVAWGGVGKTMLVQHWLQRLQHEGWFGARRVYAWSFYSQGTKEDRQASEDTFLAHALEWFGVQCEPTLSPWDKGRLLADAVTRERTLLILDGIEPLQYPPGPMGGQLRAPGVQSLLKQLARKANSVKSENQNSQSETNCLCLVTTREPLTDLADFQRREGSPWGSVLRVDLGNLTDEAGAALLHHAGANRAGAAEIKPDDKELLAASREVDGHALTLNLLGRFLARAHGGDIRRRDLVKFEEANRKEQGGTTFKMLAAFENWFARSGEFGARQLAVLRMLGLFDRPADAGCIGALRNPPVIAGLTDPLFQKQGGILGWIKRYKSLPEEEWNTASAFLSDFGLIGIYSDGQNFGHSIDAHPLIREYFARQLRTKHPKTWCAAHKRLYRHLRETTMEGDHPTLEDIQPLYQAVTHGCQAGMLRETLVKIYNQRIRHGFKAEYATKKLGAFGSDLGAVACFFEIPWLRVSPALSDLVFTRAFIQNQAAYTLRALGRLTEAVDPIRAALNDFLKLENWVNAAITASNLSELNLILGEVTEAISAARQAVTYADRSGKSDLKISKRTTLADALHQASSRGEAEIHFREAEMIQKNFEPEEPLIYALSGFQYCDLLLVNSERKALQVSCYGDMKPLDASNNHQAALRSVSQRAAQTIKIVQKNNFLLMIALDDLTLGRAALYEAVLTQCCIRNSQSKIEIAVDDLRRSGKQDYLPRGLLTRAWQRFLTGARTGTESAQADLDEAWDIAERGPMRLQLADIHLHRARLFFREKRYPWKSPQADLAAAEKLINDCGYHRRDEELADAKKAILGNT